METISEYEIIEGYKIPKEEIEMAKIMLVNLPNNPNQVSGFRIYDGRLVMIAPSRSTREKGLYDYLPVSDIVSYLKKQDISKIKDHENNLVKGLTKIMKDIKKQFTENAFRLYGFDGVYNYLKWAMKKDNKDYKIKLIADFKEVKDDVNLTPKKEEFKRYRIKDGIFGYNYGFRNGSSLPSYVNTEDIAAFINDQRTSRNLQDGLFGKWCTGCNDPERMCPFTKERYGRSISFDISEDGQFIDHGNYKQ